MESSRQIEDTAADWIVRRDSEEWTRVDEGQLSQWLSASPAHRVAYLRLEAAWEQSLRLQALGAGTPRGVVPPSGKWRVSPFFERRQASSEQGARPRMLGASKRNLLALAASILVALGIGAYFVVQQQGDRYVTPIGGLASIPLSDGSNVTLNSESKIRVVLNEQQRLVKLEGGEAFFDVAKDAMRPFIVQAGKKRVVAVGTRFAVRREGEEIHVVVSEGSVRVEDAIPEVSSRGAPRILAAGAIAHSDNAKLVIHHETARAAEEALSWRTGYLTFETQPLSAAIAEFNRYTPRKIVISDPEVASLHVSGKFRATNAEAFIRVLRDGFGIQAQEMDDHIVLTGARGAVWSDAVRE